MPRSPIPPPVPGRPSSSARRPPRGEPSVRSGSGRARQLGSVSDSLSASSLTLPPGGCRKSFTLNVATPNTPGDESGSVVLTDHRGPSFAAVTTIPVTLRSLVPTPSPSSTFTGVLTGGNGRQFNSGQTAYYEVSIPAGTPVLNAEITTPNAANTFLAELVDPVTGEAASTASNMLATTMKAGTTLVPQLGTQLHVLHPDPGAVDAWSSTSTTKWPAPHSPSPSPSPWTGPRHRTAHRAYPDSPSTSLAAGKARTVHVKVTNPGTTPEAYFVDARLDQSVQLNLASSTGSTVTVPVPSTTVPQYLVPSHTTSITATASAKRPDLLRLLLGVRRPRPDLIVSTLQRLGQRVLQLGIGRTWGLDHHPVPGRSRRGERCAAGEGEDLSVRHHRRIRPGRHSRRPATCGWPAPTCPHRSTRWSSSRVRRSTFRSRSRRRARSGAR